MPNEDPVREMTICHYPQHEEKDPRTCCFPYNPKLVARDFKDIFFKFYFIFIPSLQPFSLTIFTKAENPNQIHHFGITAYHLYEENPSICSILELLCCSGFTTAVGGI